MPPLTRCFSGILSPPERRGKARLITHLGGGRKSIALTTRGNIWCVCISVISSLRAPRLLKSLFAQIPSQSPATSRDEVGSIHRTTSPSLCRCVTARFMSALDEGEHFFIVFNHPFCTSKSRFFSVQTQCISIGGQPIGKREVSTVCVANKHESTRASVSHTHVAFRREAGTITNRSWMSDPALPFIANRPSLHPVGRLDTLCPACIPVGPLRSLSLSSAHQDS